MSQQSIIRPSHPRSHPERFAECQKAIEDRLVDIIGDARIAGWDKDEVLAAITGVSDGMALALNASVVPIVAADLARLWRRTEDKTQQKKIPDALIPHEQQLAIATRVGRLGVWDYDIRRDALYCDETWYQILGRQPSSSIISIGEFRQWIHPSDVEKASEVEKTSADLIASNQDYLIEFRVVRPNGDIRWVRSGAILEKEANKAIRAIGFLNDITDRKMDRRQ